MQFTHTITYPSTLLVRLSLIKERVSEIHGVLSDTEILVDYLIENEVTPQN